MTVNEVAAAADALVAAFGSHDRDAYFAAFDPDATFVFHTSNEVLTSRQAYESVWASWESEGFRVLECTTSDRRIDMVSDDVAILTHAVRTVLDGVDEVQRERETIVFRRSSDGRWLGIHEHLSADPNN